MIPLLFPRRKPEKVKSMSPTLIDEPLCTTGINQRCTFLAKCVTCLWAFAPRTHCQYYLPWNHFFVELSHQGQILKLIKKHTQPNPGNQHLTRSTFSSRTVASTQRGTRLEMQEIKSVSPTLISTRLQNQHQTRLAPHYLLGTVLKCLRLSYSKIKSRIALLTDSILLELAH